MDFDYLCLGGKNGLKLNPLKFQFCRKEIDFAGFQISWERFKLSKDMVSSIKCFPMPEKPTISDISAWFGFVNQLAPFLITTINEAVSGIVKD